MSVMYDMDIVPFVAILVVLSGQMFYMAIRKPETVGRAHDVRNNRRGKYSARKSCAVALEVDEATTIQSF
jgi:hypothetical protein